VTDIVKRLRAPDFADGILGEAADEIEQLRGDLKGRDAVCDSYADENQRFYDEIERLRAQNAELLTALRAMVRAYGATDAPVIMAARAAVAKAEKP
jgi:hypothetical protein